MDIRDLKPSGPQGEDILARERDSASFRVDEMANLIFGQEYLDRLSRILPIVENDPALDKKSRYYLGRNDLFRASLARSKRVAQLSKKHGWNAADKNIVDWLINAPHPYALHSSMYINTLRSQTDEEQKITFLKPAEEYTAIGCYAQTELGHGSNVQGLETEATYDKESQQFIINSPYLTAAKWWIGSLGRTANHAVVMAQLIIDGKRYGVHPFHIQIRDMKTFKPLPGISIADIGPKMGYQGIDNGTMLFNNVRVPHNSMLARYSKVDKATGKYIKPPNAKLTYGTMTWVRTQFVLISRLNIAKAATVAVRYCAIRRQFQDKEHPLTDSAGRQIESHVLDYATVQSRLFLAIATAFAANFMGQQMVSQYEENQKNMNAGSFDLLADLHATSSGLKSLITTVTTDMIETCRRACGGHGFSMFSGLVNDYQDYVPKNSTEGDNFMITQQVGRYLLKTLRELNKRNFKTPKNVTEEYLVWYHEGGKQQKWVVKNAADLSNPRNMVDALAYRAAILAFNLYERASQGATTNDLLNDIYTTSVAHSQYFLVRAFAMAFNEPALNTKPELSKVLLPLFQLHALTILENSSADLLASGFMDGKQYQLIRTMKPDLLHVIRPNAVALVDSFKIPDYQLDSSLGKFDGRVYQDMLRRVALEPLNQTTFNSDYRSAELALGEPPYQPLVDAMRMDSKL